MTEASTAGPNADLAALVGAWQLDPSATTVTLHTKAMWGMVKVTGVVAATEGDGAVAADGTVTGALVLDAASIDTSQAKRDKHLRGKDFFDVDQYPTFRYAVTAVHPGSDGTLAVAGTFTAHGQTHPLPVTATVARTAPDSVTVTGTAELDRSRWGIGWTKMGARLDNHVDITAVFTRS